jgi:hypothetical protein
MPLAGSIVIVAAAWGALAQSTHELRRQYFVFRDYYFLILPEPQPLRMSYLQPRTFDAPYPYPSPSPPGAPATQPSLPYEALYPLKPLPPNPARRLSPFPYPHTITRQTHYYRIIPLIIPLRP